MKRLFLFIFLPVMLALLCLPSCMPMARARSYAVEQISRSKNDEEPSASMHYQTPIHTIVLRSSADIILRQGTGTVVDIYRSDEIGTLTLNGSSTRGNGVTCVDGSLLVDGNRIDKVNVTTDLSHMRNIVVNGSGGVYADRIEGASFSGVLQGSGDISVKKLNCSNVDVVLQGSADIDIGSVECSSMSAVLRGSGDLDFNNIKAVSLALLLQGAGDINVTGIDCNQVNAVLQGAGDITLRGSCRSLNATNQGVGDLDASGLKTGRQSVY